MIRRFVLASLLVPTFIAGAQAQSLASDPSSSGGELIYEQAAFDVHYYDLQLDVHPAQQALVGRLSAHATITLPADRLVLDLDTTFAVSKIVDADGEALAFERHGGRLWIQLGETKKPGDSVMLTVDYEGQPRVAPRPPWDGGFTWVERPDGTYWVGVSCQGEGADLWWPVKDHPTDEPDSLRIRATVPAGHSAISSGRLQSEAGNEDGTATFDWFVSTPINNYGLSLYVAPYEVVTTPYTSTAGDDLPLMFYVLPEYRSKAEALLPQMVDQMRFFEEMFGPYPFRADKYAVVHAPYFGMEHQTAIAYGNRFENNAFGFDYILLHELAHEWWGNLVTVPDWQHFWVHEGTAAYTEALYVEAKSGMEMYHAYMQGLRARIGNRGPVVPGKATDTQAAYFGGTTDAGNDIYNKGAWFLHTIRYAIDDDPAFFRALRRMAYPTPELEAVTDGRQTRFATTDDFQRTLQAETDYDLAPLFRLYLYQPALPRLVSERDGDEVHLRWETPEGYPLSLPVEVAVDGEVQRVPMPSGEATVRVPAEAELALDPQGWILKAGDDR